MIKKTNNTINTNKDKTVKAKSNPQNSGGHKKRGRPKTEGEDQSTLINNKASSSQDEELEIEEDEEEDFEESKDTNTITVKKGRKAKQPDKYENHPNSNNEGEMDDEMKEMYKLLDKFDATKLEKFNTVISMYRQKPRTVNTIVFKVNQDVNLDIEYYNTTTPQQLQLLFASDSIVLTNGTGVSVSGKGQQQQQQQQQLTNDSLITQAVGTGLIPLERYRLILEYKDYNSRSELDRITKSQGARKFRNYVGNQVMEQFHRPLLGKLLNQFEELRQHVKYDNGEINLRFENFNIVGSSYVMMAILKYFVESGTMTMRRKNGFNADIQVTHTESPTFKISFTK